MEKKRLIQYISLQEASQQCAYSQEYLSLRARQNKLKAVKVGRNWVTTKEWLKEYISRAQSLKEMPVPAESVKPEVAEARIVKPMIGLETLKAKKRALLIAIPREISKKTRWVNDFCSQFIDSCLFLTEKIILSRLVKLFGLFRLLRGVLEESRGSLEESIGQIIESGLLFIDKLWLELRNSIVRIEYKYKLNQPRIISAVILTITILFSVILPVLALVNPRISSSLISETDKIVSDAFNKASDFVFKGGESSLMTLGTFLKAGEKARNQSILALGQAVSQLESELPDSLWYAWLKVGEFSFVAGKEIINYGSQRITQLSQLPQKAVSFYLRIARKNEEIKSELVSDFYGLAKDTPDFIGTALSIIADNLSQAPAKISFYSKSAYSKAIYGLSDWLSDIPSKLSDTGEDLSQKLIFAISDINSATQRAEFDFKQGTSNFAADFSDNLNYFNQQLFQAPRKIQSWLGDNYLRIARFFDRLIFGEEQGLVYSPEGAPAENLDESIDQLKENIINDVQQRFTDFKTKEGLPAAEGEKQGLIVVPAGADEEKTKKKIEELSQAFSDEVAVKTDETGKAGVIQPIFKDQQFQKYLYMMVPIKEQ